jgi:hypothetical protein
MDKIIQCKALLNEKNHEKTLYQIAFIRSWVHGLEKTQELKSGTSLTTDL